MNDLIYIGLTLAFLMMSYGLIVLFDNVMEDKS